RSGIMWERPSGRDCLREIFRKQSRPYGRSHIPHTPWMGKVEAFALLSAALWAYGVILYKRLGESVRPLALNLQKNLIVLALIVPTWWLVDGALWPRLDAGSIALCF